MAKVLVAMSGGVDSSTTALLLKEQGYECIGATMRLCTEELTGIPPKKDDVEDARKICAHLGIPFVELDCAAEFERDVVKDFVESYKAGLTPNPCLVCNKHLKFGLFYEKAKELGCDYIATGHYARILRDGEGRPRLAKGVDETKDQSYVLYSLDQEKLSHVLFPLGGYTKSQVREIAARNGLATAQKGESEDICFIPQGNYLDFLRRYDGYECEEGGIVDSAGQVIGTHQGAIAYTVGQRKGLGIGGLKEPYFVCGKDMAANTVLAGPESMLYASQLIARDWNWCMPPVEGEFRARVRTRYHQTEQTATLGLQSDGRMLVVFDDPQRAIAPGQAVVAYDGDMVIGGGVIC